MNEKKFQDLVIGLFQQKGAHAVNMEPGATNEGIPDVNWCMEGIEGNIELKFGHEGKFAPRIRPMQLVWFRERIKAGGYPMLAYYITNASYSDDVLIFQGRCIDALAHCKRVQDIYDVEHLRVLDPDHLVEGLLSEMASWHDELHPEIFQF